MEPFGGCIKNVMFKLFHLCQDIVDKLTDFRFVCSIALGLMKKRGKIQGLTRTDLDLAHTKAKKKGAITAHMGPENDAFPC